MAVDINKVKIISSYFAENIDDLYMTKLMKLFYYLDFIAVAERGSSITGDVYYKLPYGPVPSFIKSEVDTLVSNEAPEGYKSLLASNLEPVEIKDGSFRAFVLKNKAKRIGINDLSEYERKLTETIVTKFKKANAKKLTEKTHKEKPYLLTPDNSVIDYSLASLLDLKTIFDC